MKIWISKNSEVPVAEQLATQITLGVASGDFAVGEKLPSTREIARRCGVHSNTVGAVYRKLASQNLLEFRHGSGFYVAETAGKSIEGSRRLEQLIDDLLAAAAEVGLTNADLIRRLKKSGTRNPSERILLVEPDNGLRDILLHELLSKSLPARGVDYDELKSSHHRRSTLLTAMFDEKPKLDSILNDGEKCVYLKGRSVSAAMSGESRPSGDELIAVVSGWDGFLTFARIMLLAAKVDPGNLIVRSTTDDDWKKAIQSASLIICDSLTASSLPGIDSVRAFRIVSDESIAELVAALGKSAS